MEDLPAAIRRVFAAKRDRLREMHTHAASGGDPDNATCLADVVCEEYDGHEVNVHIDIFHTGESHRLRTRKGQFSICIEAEMEENMILTDVEPFLHDVHEELLPDIESNVQRNYSMGTLTIEEKVKTDEFEAWFIEA